MGKGREACIIGALLWHDRERRGCGLADMVVWRMSDPPGPIKLKATGVV